MSLKAYIVFILLDLYERPEMLFRKESHIDSYSML